MQSRVVKNGVMGQKEVVYLVTKENGVEVKREKLRNCVKRAGSKGHRRRPCADTIGEREVLSGLYAGRGRISSGYGWRGGDSTGIDIAA